MGRVPRIPCPDAGSSHQTGCRAHPSARRLGRDRVRRELRRPGRLSRARESVPQSVAPTRARAHARPLRGRRAPDERVRRPHPVAARPRARGVDAPDLQGPRHPHADEDLPLDPPVDVLYLRHPELCARCAQAPDVHFDTAKVDSRTDSPCTRPRRPHRAADRRRPRLAAGALQRARPSSRPTPLAGPEVHPHASGDDPSCARPRLRARATPEPPREELRRRRPEPRDRVKEPPCAGSGPDVPAVRW